MSTAGLIAAACTAALAASTGEARAANTPVAGVTGWDADLVVESGATSATAATSAAFDVTNNYVFYQAGLSGGGTDGLPSSGAFTSASNASTSFQLQPYTANNVLYFDKGNGGVTTGTLALGTPSAFSSLSVLTDAANNASTLGYTINYANGTNQAGSFTAMDWFFNTPYAIGGLGRLNRTTGLTGFTNTTDGSTGNPRIYEVDITNPNPALAISSITFTQTAGNSAAVWALSGTVSIPPTNVTYTGSVNGASNGAFDTTTPNFSSNGSSAAFSNGAVVTFDDTATGTTNVTVAAAGVSPGSVTFNNNSKAYTFTGGPIAGGASLAFNGSGTVTLNNPNTFTGPTVVNSGTLVIGAAGADASTALTVASNATLTVLAGGQLTAATPALTANGTVTFNNSANVLGALTGTGTVNVNGTALTVGTGSAYTGSFSGTGGSLNVTGGAVTFSSPSSLAVLTGGVTVTGTNTAGGTILLNDNGGQLGLNAAGAPITITSNGGTVGVPANTNATYAGNVVAAGTATTTLSTSNSGSLTLTGSLSGPGPVAITSAGGGSNLTLSGPDTGTGPVTITGGANALLDTFYVNLRSTAALSGQAGLTLGSGAGFVEVDLAGNNESVAYLSAGGSANQLITSSTGSPTLTITSGNAAGGSASFGSVLTGGLALVKAGSGTQILTAANTYGGGTTISAGTLAITNPLALSNGTVTLNGGTLGLNVPKVISGFAGFATPNGNATVLNSGATLQTVPLAYNVQGSAYQATPVTVNDKTGFVATFTYNPTPEPYSSEADGGTFVIQNDPRGTSALGAGGGQFGYTGIANSFAATFDIYYENPQFVGVVTGGASPSSGTTHPYLFDNYGSDPINVSLNYSNGVLTETLVDTTGAAGNAATTTFSYNVDVAAALGGTAGGTGTGYVGFTGAGGGVGSNQQISNFNFVTGNGSAGQSQTVNIANAVVAAPGTSSTIQIGVSAGTTTGSVGSLTVGSGATVHLVSVGDTTTTHGVLILPALSIATGATNAPTGRVDVGNNDLDLQNAQLSTVTAYAAAGYANGTLNGSGGIYSSVAAASTKRLTTVGVIANTDPTTGTVLYGTSGSLGLFDGANPGSGDILVKYTYFGDANLDGKVDGADYAQIDAGFLSNNALTGWYYGDFNYDGKVDASDYTLIDNAFNNQGAQLTNGTGTAPFITADSTDEIAPVAGTAAVPEPASLGLLAVAAGGLLARRRRI